MKSSSLNIPRATVVNSLLTQIKVEVAGIHIHSFGLKEISYAPVVAAVMLKRQQVRYTDDSSTVPSAVLASLSFP